MSGDPHLLDGQKINDADAAQANLYKLRRDGVSAMSSLLNEARTENRILKETNSDLERALQQLTVTLNQSGAEASEASCNMAARVQGISELYVPGISKPLMENLIRENGQLKRGGPITSQRLDELNKQVVSQQALIESLRADKHKLEQENTDLQRVIQASGDELREERVQLIERLRRADEKYCTQSADCRMYCTRLDELKEQLADTARRCLEVRHQLKPNTHHSNTITLPTSPVTCTSNLPASSLSVSSAKQTHASNMQSTGPHTDQHQADRQKAFSEGRTIGHQHLLSEDEPRPPERKNHSRAANQQLLEENGQLQELLTAKDSEILKLREHQLMLQHQLEVYRDDFKREKTDREHTHQKYTDIKDELFKYKSMVPVHQQQKRQQPSSLNAWDANQGRKSTNQASSNTKALQTNPSASRIEQPTLTQELACSRCGKKYNSDKRDELVEHMEKCVS